MFIVDSKGNCWRDPNEFDPREAPYEQFAREPEPKPNRFPWGKFTIVACLLCVIVGAIGVTVYNWDSQPAPAQHSPVPHVVYAPILLPSGETVMRPMPMVKPIQPPMFKPPAPIFRPPSFRPIIIR